VALPSAHGCLLVVVVFVIVTAADTVNVNVINNVDIRTDVVIAFERRLLRLIPLRLLARSRSAGMRANCAGR
jgi:hypothetical protein